MAKGLTSRSQLQMGQRANHRMNGRGSRVVHSQSHGCTLADVFFPFPFLGFVYTAIACCYLIRCKAMKEANTLQGQSENHSPLLTTQLRLIKSYYSVSAILVFLYILTIDYFSMSVLSCFIFFCLFIVQVSKVMGVQAL